eukprot:278333-Rhodomonas_salina.2
MEIVERRGRVVRGKCRDTLSDEQNMTRMALSGIVGCFKTWFSWCCRPHERLVRAVQRHALVAGDRDVLFCERVALNVRNRLVVPHVLISARREEQQTNTLVSGLPAHAMTPQTDPWLWLSHT